MLDLPNIETKVAAFQAALRKELARVNLEIATAYRKWALVIHADIVRLTPQWGGNLAANWYIDVGAPSSSAQDLGDPSVRNYKEPRSTTSQPPYARGMDPAVGISLARAKQLALPSLHDRLFIHNPVEYAEAVELDVGPRPIRAINRVPRAQTGKVAMVYHAYLKYSLTGSYFL